MATTTTKPQAKAKLAGMQTKAKAAYDKGTATFGEAKTFTKGNIDAIVESGKIMGAGLKKMGESYVVEGKTAMATASADFKELTSVKSPTDFFKLQSKIFGRNLGTVIDFQTKNAEAMFKLAKDSAAPLSKRVGVALEAVRKTA